MKARYWGLRAGTALLTAALATGTATIGRAQADQAPNTGNLNIPNNVAVRAPHDPSVRKATAIVNGAIITDTDVDQRLALALVSSQGKVNDEERAQLRVQILSNLIDETLQIQEAAANKLTPDRKEIDDAVARIARQFKRTPTDFAAYVRSQGSNIASLRRQIESEIAWRRVLSREVEPYVSVSDEEVRQVISRLEASKGSAEYHVSEIFLSATPATQDQVGANAQRIVEQVRQGASFPAYARQYSEASTAAVGGDLGWVRSEQLPDALSTLLPQMQPGTLAGPVPVGGGFSILALIDKRQILVTDPRDTALSLKQISINFPANASAQAAKPRLDAFTEGLKQLKGCGEVAAFAQKINGTVVDNDAIRVRDFPPALQNIMLGLRVGEATPPFGSSEEGVRALVVCGRDEPESPSLPSFEQIQSQMSDDRVNLRARRYLRDLRRDAIIEYR
ncbi:peptidylprolyl isomerase [uncultured Sphingomonas sp.]|uniref:peptidylprolyl isomerase n=1 Tax=uncultured Sphingomonas sp. TaxID=158754 RepID=UPI0025FF7FA7|nr:peptidylprolyl isomerase [uncultured Sphingomonas sp.]